MSFLTQLLYLNWIQSRCWAVHTPISGQLQKINLRYKNKWRNCWKPFCAVYVASCSPFWQLLEKQQRGLWRGTDCNNGQHAAKRMWLERMPSSQLFCWDEESRVAELVWRVYLTCLTLLWKITAVSHNYQRCTEIMSNVAVTSGGSNCWGQLHACLCFWHPAAQNSWTICHDCRMFSFFVRIVKYVICWCRHHTLEFGALDSRSLHRLVPTSSLFLYSIIYLADNRNLFSHFVNNLRAHTHNKHTPTFFTSSVYLL